MCANPFVILTYIYIQFPYTQYRHTTFSVSITRSHPTTRSLIWPFGVLNQTTPKWSEQFLYLNSGQEVGLYLFPVPALFLQGLGYLRLFILTMGPQWALLHCFATVPKQYIKQCGATGFSMTLCHVASSTTSEGWWKWTNAVWMKSIKSAGTTYSWQRMGLYEVKWAFE